MAKEDLESDSLEYTGLGVSGYGKVLKRKKGESIKSLVKRQTKEYSDEIKLEKGKKKGDKPVGRPKKPKTRWEKAFAPAKRIKADRRKLGSRAKGVSTLFGTRAIGVDRGAGRPVGTYKYGMPIHEYKKLQSRKKALMEQYQYQKQMELRRKGISPERAEQLRLVQAVKEDRQMPLGVLETPQSVMSAADEDLAFRRFRADKTISPNTQNILRRLRHTQLKSQRDDVEMQRRLKERKMVSKAGSLLATPFIFNRNQLDFTGVNPEENILMAPNVFREIPENRIMKTNRPNILQSRETGFNLDFFGQRRQVTEDEM